MYTPEAMRLAAAPWENNQSSPLPSPASNIHSLNHMDRAQQNPLAWFEGAPVIMGDGGHGFPSGAPFNVDLPGGRPGPPNNHDMPSVQSHIPHQFPSVNLMNQPFPPAMGPPVVPPFEMHSMNGIPYPPYGPHNVHISPMNSTGMHNQRKSSSSSRRDSNSQEHRFYVQNMPMNNIPPPYPFQQEYPMEQAPMETSSCFGSSSSSRGNYNVGPPGGMPAPFMTPEGVNGPNPFPWGDFSESSFPDNRESVASQHRQMGAPPGYSANPLSGKSGGTNNMIDIDTVRELAAITKRFKAALAKEVQEDFDELTRQRRTCIFTIVEAASDPKDLIGRMKWIFDCGMLN